MVTICVVVFLLSGLVFLAALVGAAFLRGRRGKSLGIAILSLGSALISVGAYSYAFDAEAKSQGFDGFVDRGQAKDAGYDDPEAWAEVREEHAAKRSAEIREQVAARKAAEAADEARMAAEASAPTTEELECRADLICWGDKQVVWAGFHCPPEINKLATYRANWTDSWLELKVSHYRWLDKDAATLTMIGDRVEFENGFGAAVNMIYECDIDPLAEVVLAVRVYEGRL